MVGWGYDNLCIGIFQSDFAVGVHNAGRGVAAHRFTENVLYGDFRQLFVNNAAVFLVGYDIYVFVWDNLCKAIESLLYQSPSNTKNVKELLWHIRTAYRPETASDATCHYHAVVCFVHCVHSESRIFIILQSNNKYLG